MKNKKNIVHGFKVFRSDWTCSPNGNTKQYKPHGKFKEKGHPVIFEYGMHFCQKFADCFECYPLTKQNKYAEIIAYGEVITKGKISCTNKLEIVREIPWTEVLQIINTGKKCVGVSNTGNRNAGNYNTGDNNIGDCNVGDFNIGNNNAGWCNKGDRNVGELNIGCMNVGNYNIGDYNVGDWNKSSFNVGCFNTKEQKITMFNKLSDMTYSQWVLSYEYRLLNSMPKLGGVQIIDTGLFNAIREARQKWWNELTKQDKKSIMGLPNFDSIIFLQCTGINVESEEIINE